MLKNFSKTELRHLSQQLLHLHKALLEFQKKDYEGKFGKIESPGKLLNLLMSNAQFSWLRALSGLVVAIDEIVDSKEEVDEKQIADLIVYTKTLLAGSQEGSEFSKKYFAALQADPYVALAHGKIMQILKS
jgi:hypothetical protein